MNRAALIEQIQEARATLEKLLTLLQSTRVERDRSSDVRNCVKSGKQIERCVISSFQVAEGMGLKGELRQWEHLLRVGD
jgi:hypothetical protein